MSTTANLKGSDNTPEIGNGEEEFLMEDSSSCPGPIVRRIEQLVIERGTPKRKVRALITEITGIGKSGLVKWFSGDTAYPAVPHLELIADYFGESIDWLVKGEDSLRSNSPSADQEELNDVDTSASSLTVNAPGAQGLTINQHPSYTSQEEASNPL